MSMSWIPSAINCASRACQCPWSARSYEVLVYLVQQADRLVTKHELLEAVWPEVYVDDSAVARCIGAVRQAVGDGRAMQRVIRTVHGQGYRFVAPVVEQHVDAGSTSPSAPPPPAPARAPVPAPPPTTTLLRPCHACQQPNATAAQCCTACGVPLVAVCPACGQRVPLPASFCPGCGQTLERPLPLAVPASASSPAISPPHAAPAFARGERKRVTVLSGLLSPLVGWARIPRRCRSS